jgi:hypothetical protein
MTQSELEKVAEALRDSLTDAPFTKEFVPVESFDTDMELEDADTLRVDVVPVSQEPKQSDRGAISWTNTLEIGVRFRFGNLDQEESDGKIRNRHMHEWIYFMQEISQYLYSNPKLPLFPKAELLPTVVVIVTYSTKHLREWRQFTGIIRVEYRTETLLS